MPGLSRLAIAACGATRVALLALVALAALAPPAYAAAPKKAPAWKPAACPPVPEHGGGASNVKVTGPCAFEHKGDAECVADGDDMLVSIVRKTKSGAEVMLFVNVERYVGPGHYKAPNDIFVSLMDGSTIYRWSTNEAEVTVGPESKSVTFKEARLEPELVLVGCTGPQNNYQCDGRGDEPRHMHSSSTVSGTAHCRTAAPAKWKPRK